MIDLDYVIKNHKNVYIKLNHDGKPVTCTEREKSLFEFSKAKNICGNLPKTLKKLNFNVEPIPDIMSKQDESGKTNVISGEDYSIPDTVLRWLDKFGICDELINEARKRKDELVENLSNADKEFSNIIHKIELEKPKDLYQGWLLYKEVKTNRKKRRCIKDELLIISGILKMDFRNFDSQNIKKAVDGLANRKFAVRIVEEDEDGIL